MLDILPVFVRVFGWFHPNVRVVSSECLRSKIGMFEVKEWVVFVIILGAKYRIWGCKMSNLGVQNVEFGSAKRRKSGAKYRIGRAKYRILGCILTENRV